MLTGRAGPTRSISHPAPTIPELISAVSHAEVDRAKAAFEAARQRRLNLEVQRDAALEAGIDGGPFAPVRSDLLPEQLSELRAILTVVKKDLVDAVAAEAKATEAVRTARKVYLGRLRAALSGREAEACAAIGVAYAELLEQWTLLDEIGAAFTKAGAPPPPRVTVVQLKTLLSKIMLDVGVAA
jgi:hypothetical protein